MTEPVASCSCRYVELKVPSVTGSLPIVRAVIERILAPFDASPDEVTGINLAVDEALANVIKHGYGGATGQFIRMCVGVVDEAAGPTLTITVRDQGRQVDPGVIGGRDLDDVRPGGLGVHIMRSVMDSVEYSRPECGGMMLKMSRRIRGSGP